MPTLEIHSAQQGEVYRDLVRIPESERRDQRGWIVDEGKVCRIQVNGRSTLVVLRGTATAEFVNHNHRACIHMDEVTRRHLRLENSMLGEAAEFEITPLGRFGEFRWAWNATEIGYRISSRLALLGLLLGVISIVLAIPELVNWICWFLS